MQRLRTPFVPIALASLFALAGATHAQLSRAGTPASFSGTGSLGAFEGELPIEMLPAPDIAALLAEDEANGPFPYRYGDMIETSIGLFEQGRWDSAEDGTVIWRVEIFSPGAFSLGVLFEEFDLPSLGEVYIYDPAKTQVLGAYTEANEQENGMLAIEPIIGDRLVIEYIQRPGTAELPRLRVGSVVHDYRDLFTRLANQAIERSAICFVDINCPEGAPYQDIKRSVVEVIASGAQCSAAILNNTAEDGTPYMLTANHCGNQTNGIQIFAYERTGCSIGPSSTSKTLSGSTKLASNSGFDSQLYVLNSAPPESFDPFYAGWGTGNAPQGPMVGIHHAQGNPKKISIDNGNAIVDVTRFGVDWDVGMVHGGSSGSPLFNKSKRVVGPACCVSDFNCNTQLTLYGRFDKFYSSNSLAQWLDPLGLNPGGIDGYDPFAPIALAEQYNGSDANPLVYTGNPPTLGTTWFGSVSASGHPGAVSTLILGYLAESSGTFLASGELLIDLSSPFVFQSIKNVSGTSSIHSAPIPTDPALAGMVAYSQAAILGGGVELTNGLKLTLN